MKGSDYIVVAGGKSFVGSNVISILAKKDLNFLIPSKKELDITDFRSIKKYCLMTRPKILINFAAYTDIERAQKEIGSKSKRVWKINAVGPKKLADVCKQLQIFLIHISTDSVFPGSAEYPGPYRESDPTFANLKYLSWYSYTKLLGEKTVIDSGAKFAIIRISYPFGSRKSQKDFLIKTVKYIKSGVGFFSDQNFTPTYIPDLTIATAAIMNTQKKGIYHVTCTGLTSPYLFAAYLNEKLALTDQIKEQIILNYRRNPSEIPRSKYGGLLNERTQRILNIKLHSWKSAIDNYLDDLQFGTGNYKLTA